MTAGSLEIPAARFHPALAALIGAFFGAMAASMIKGTLIGIEQMNGDFGWLSVPMGAIAGPMILCGDLMVLAEGGPLEHIAVLPWAVLGLLVGVAAGLWYARPRAGNLAAN